MTKKKFRIWLVFLFFLNVSLFSYDKTTLMSERTFQNVTRYSFIQNASVFAEASRTGLRGSRNNNTVDKFFLIGADDADTEDVQVINDIEAYIRSHFRISNGDVFGSAVKRGDLNRGYDGWVINSHYSSSQGWLHYLYYFSIIYK